MNTSRRLVFPALISAGVLWGTTVPLSKIALAWLPPAGLAFARFALAGGLLALVRGSRLRAAASPAILVSGALGYGGSVVLQNFGIERTSVSHAALLIGATPVLVALLAAICGHGVARPAAWLGFAMSLAGVGVIAAGKGGGATAGGDSLVLAGQFASAAFTVAQARLLRDRDAVAVTALQLLAAAVVTLPVALVSGGLHTAPARPGVVLATAALILAGTVGPTTLFTYAQARVPADVAGAFLNLEPLVGAVAGAALFANPMGGVQLAGAGAILTGVGLGSLQAVRGSQPASGGPDRARAGLPAATLAPARPGPVEPDLALAATPATPVPGPVPSRSAMAAAIPAGQPAGTRRTVRPVPAAPRMHGASQAGHGGTGRAAGWQPDAPGGRVAHRGSVAECDGAASRHCSRPPDSADSRACTSPGRQAAHGPLPAGPSSRTRLSVRPRYRDPRPASR